MTGVSPTSPIRQPAPHPRLRGPPEPGGHAEWEYVTERLSRALMYWVATTGPKGQPHAVPYLGAFVDDVLYFETAPTTRGGKNLRHQPGGGRST